VATGVPRTSTALPRRGQSDGDPPGRRRLPWQVSQSGQSAWITDVVDDENFPRAAAAARAGLHSAFCFPLQSGDGVEGLAEFFSPRRMDPAPELLATMASLGSRVGESLRRQRVDRAMRLSEARLRAVLAAALTRSSSPTRMAWCSNSTPRRAQPSATSAMKRSATSWRS
jgi:hypothetical protein